MTLTIKTDHKWKQFKYRYEVPGKVLEDTFSWTNDEDQIDGYFCYRGNWYHLDDFMRLGYVNEFKALSAWDGYAADSFYSGVVIRVSPDGETYQVGTYIS